MHFDKAEGHAALAQDLPRITHAMDQWMLGRLSVVVKKATEAFEAYEYADARQTIEDCFWKDWCDNYLELCKTRIYAEEDSAARQSAALTLWHGTQLFLKLLAPFIPFVTDELFSHLYAADYLKHGSIHHRGSWPQAFNIAPDALLKAGEDVIDMLAAIRKLKAEKNLSVKYPLTSVQVEKLPEGIPTTALEELMADMLSAANAPSYAKGKPSALASSMALEGGKGAIGVEFAASSEAA
jgi:valyl-tRNA synthetase